MHPLSIQITTRDGAEKREVRQEYLLETRHPRWQLIKIMFHAVFNMKFR
ncbi:MAG: hypothetical protein ACKVRP_00105 [Bacteroidota bacterium]